MAEFFQMFGVEPRHLIVQIIGFVVLVWALKKYLFSPVGNLLDERSRQVKETLNSVEKEKQDLEALKEKYHAHLEKIEDEHRAKVAQFIKEGEEIKQRIVAEAKAEAEKALSKGKERLKQEEQTMLATMRDEIAEIVLHTTKNVLGELVNEEVQQKAVARSLKELAQAPWR